MSMGGSRVGADGSVASWNQEWRAGVTQQLADSATAHRQTGIILERLSNHMDDHDRRIKTLEGQPDGLRANLGTYGGCVSQIILASLSVLGTLTGITGTIIAIISLLHH